MTVIATALKHMLAAGMPHDAIVAAVADMEASAPAAVDPVAEKRRAYDRERKRAAKAERNSTGIPPEAAESAESVESVETAPLSPAPLPFPQTPKPTPHPHTPVNIHPAREPKSWERPDWADAEVWADLLTNRKRKRLPNTATALSGFMRKLDTVAAQLGQPPGEVLRECVERGWGMIYNYEESDNGGARQARDNRSGRRSSGPANGQFDSRDGFGAALREAGVAFADAPAGDAYFG